jgi:hypothetical protein
MYGMTDLYDDLRRSGLSERSAILQVAKQYGRPREDEADDYAVKILGKRVSECEAPLTDAAPLRAA